ncbi:hypothetical protein EcWSU1_03021 [Enterobacter ludwigii]|uniref:Uncharacterized protein n=1 Tax=Enterobacter ludwigii TaxID=299767 RepID=G8LJQ1_9ENTR|nr:hypothetical protein EcWSU1_03021 [Enterobacter ludwigii]
MRYGGGNILILRIKIALYAKQKQPVTRILSGL